MDEYLINASLQERKPSSLPWSSEGKHRKIENSFVDQSKTPTGKSDLTNSKHNHLTFKDETFERKCNVGSRYMGVDPDAMLHAMKRSRDAKEMEFSQSERKSKCEELTYSGSRPLSMNDVTQSSSEYCRKIPKLDTFNNIREKDGASPASACLSEGDTIIQSNRRKSPRCSLKVSRTIIQQSKLGYSVPLQSGRTFFDRKDQMSTGSSFILKNEDDVDTNQIEQRQVYESLQRKCYTTKNLDGAVSSSKTSKMVNRGMLSDNSDTCRKSDLDIDNELDDLLKVTADAMNHGVSKNDEGKESTIVNESIKRQAHSKDEKTIYVERSTCKFKDNDRQNISVSNTLSSERKVDDTVSTDQNNDSHKRRDVKNCIEEISKFRRDIRDIKKKMDIIDGIGVGSFDKEAQNSLRQRPKTNKLRQTKGQEKGKGGGVLEIKTKHGNIRQAQLKDAKDEKAIENKSISRDFRNVQCTKRHLVHKNDIGDDDDIFDISPVKNREILSDLEEDSTNIYGKHVERTSCLLKRDERNQFDKNGKIGDVCNNTLKPEQTQRGPSKNKSKRSKNEKKQKVKETIKENDVKLDNHTLLKKKKKKKSIRLSKTSVKGGFLPTEKSARRNNNSHIYVGRLSVKTNDEVPKTKTSNTNSLVHKTDNEITHTVHTLAVKRNGHQTRHRLKPAKSYTVIKHDRNVMTMDNENKTDKDSKASGIPSRQQHVGIVSEYERGIIKDDNQLKVDGEQDQQLPRNIQKSVDDVEATIVAQSKHYSNQRNIDSFPNIELSDEMYDSDKDSGMISDILYQEYLTYRAHSEVSHEFEFPRPASNMTFIIDSSSEDEDRIKSTHEETEHDIEQSNKEEKKVSKVRRFINFITCCCRPKTNH